MTGCCSRTPEKHTQSRVGPIIGPHLFLIASRTRHQAPAAGTQRNNTPLPTVPPTSTAPAGATHLFRCHPPQNGATHRGISTWCLAPNSAPTFRSHPHISANEPNMPLLTVGRIARHRCHPPVSVPPTSEWCHPPWNLNMVPGIQFRPHVQVPPTHFGQRAEYAVAYGWADRPTPVPPTCFGATHLRMVPPTFAGPAASRLVSPLRRCGQNAAHESAQLWDEQPAGGKRVVARRRLQAMTPNKTKLSDHFRVE